MLLLSLPLLLFPSITLFHIPSPPLHPFILLFFSLSSLFRIHFPPTPSAPTPSSLSISICPKCNVPRPPSTHHCSTCQTCRPHLDHHCPYLSACIYLANRKFYLLFLTYTFLAAILHIPPLLRFAIYTRRPNLLLATAVNLAITVIFIALIPLFSLLAWNWYLLVKGCTNVEWAKGERGKVPSLHHVTSVMGTRWYISCLPLTP